VEVFRRGAADAALIASMVHYGDYTVGQIKEYLAFVLEGPDRDTAIQIIKANEIDIPR